jgi:hypothetical protein
MPRSRPRGSLERSALADLTKHTLSQIPTLYGRLCYLASLRDPNSGVYRHHGLFLSFGREQTAGALQSSHRSVFEEWVALSLESKSQDLTAYLASLDEVQESVVRHWRQSRIYRTLLPGSASPAETELFFTELDILLEGWR